MRALVTVALFCFMATAGCLSPQGTSDREPELPAMAMRLDPASSLTISWYASEGREPSRLVLDGIGQQVERLRGPSLTIQQGGTLPTDPERKYTKGDAFMLGRSFGDFDDGRELRLLFLAGAHEPGPNERGALGFAWIAGGIAVVFPDRVPAYPPVFHPSDTQGMNERGIRSVAIHELGHLFGLVNSGVPMVRPHEDPDDPQHSSSQDSVMYPGISSGERLSILLREDPLGPVWKFDEDDVADIRAYQEQWGLR